jgi:hypothetical protein
MSQHPSNTHSEPIPHPSPPILSLHKSFDRCELEILRLTHAVRSGLSALHIASLLTYTADSAAPKYRTLTRNLVTVRSAHGEAASRLQKLREHMEAKVERAEFDVELGLRIVLAMLRWRLDEMGRDLIEAGEGVKSMEKGLSEFYGRNEWFLRGEEGGDWDWW